MANEHRAATEDARREIVTERVFDAPRERVFDAWTDPQTIGRWWGPNGFTTTTYEMDVQPGGMWRHMMHGPDGVDYPNKIVYVEVVRPERLVYDHGWDQEDAPADFRTTVTFTEMDDGKTLLTMRALFVSVEERDKAVREYGAIEGGQQTLARLAQHLAQA